MVKESTRQQGPKLIDSQALRDADNALEWNVEQILVGEQPAVIGGPKKSLKTSIACDLAISLGTATPFLGHFRVAKVRRTAVLSGESGNAVIQETAQRICEAKGVALDRQCGVFWGFELPRLADEQELAELTKALLARKIEVVVIDPLYLCLFSGSQNLSATNLYEVGPLLRRAAQACLDAGATPIFVHHTTKGSETRGAKAAEPLELGHLAFAGVAEYARQWLLLSRSQRYKPGSGRHDLVMSVGGSAGHSGCWSVAIREGACGKELRTRRWQVHVSEHCCSDPMAGPRRSSVRDPRTVVRG